MESTLSDRALIDGCLAGDQSMREQFVRRFSRLVLSSVQGAIKSNWAYISQQDIEDLHNTVFVSFFEKRCRKLRQFEGRNGCSLASWVRMVTVRAVLDLLRRRCDPLLCPEQLIPLELLPEPADGAQASPWACMVAKEQPALLEKGLQGLTARDQLMIRLHCIEDRPLAQVATILLAVQRAGETQTVRQVEELTVPMAQIDRRCARMLEAVNQANRRGNCQPMSVNGWRKAVSCFVTCCFPTPLRSASTPTALNRWS